MTEIHTTRSGMVSTISYDAAEKLHGEFLHDSLKSAFSS